MGDNKLSRFLMHFDSQFPIIPILNEHKRRDDKHFTYFISIFLFTASHLWDQHIESTLCPLHGCLTFVVVGRTRIDTEPSLASGRRAWHSQFRLVKARKERCFLSV